MKCTKAIIALGGFGTRRLPITKAIEKCMLPIGNRPIVDYIVEDCVAAGITDIIFVVGEQATQIMAYYSRNHLLDNHLTVKGKAHVAEQLQAIACKARFSYVVQDSMKPYGTSVPLMLAKNHISPDESFIFLYGDNVYYNQDGHSQIADFLATAEAAHMDSAMLGVEVPHELVSHYGIVASRQQNGLELYDHIVEKPSPEEAPSTINNAGCFLLLSDIFPFVQESIDHSAQEERYVIDAINQYVAQDHDMLVVHATAEYLDCGSMEGWLYANNRIVGQK